MVKNPPADRGGMRCSFNPWVRSPRGGHGSPLQYSCLKNPMDRGAWRATVHRVAKSRTLLQRLSMHADQMMNYKVTLATVDTDPHACIVTHMGTPVTFTPL